MRGAELLYVYELPRYTVAAAEDSPVFSRTSAARADLTALLQETVKFARESLLRRTAFNSLHNLPKQATI
jgi:hypothetical protein